jgi:mono/diheme cytochrome c family protein
LKKTGLVLMLIGLCLVSMSAAADKSVDRGAYLTTILGCGGCHTEGALLGRPSGPWLAGSSVGVAWSDYNEGVSPAVVFPSNLTSDRETGLGKWSRQDIAGAILTGVTHQRDVLVPVMPWRNYSLLKERDAQDIAAYLKSLPPTDKQIPANVPVGGTSKNAYIRVGVFIFDPADGGEKAIVGEGTTQEDQDAR